MQRPKDRIAGGTTATAPPAANRDGLDYSGVSEVPGIRITHEAVSMLQTRYSFATKFCRGKDVLEVACGAGLGLGLLARYARSVVGGDCTDSLPGLAGKHYGGRVPLVRFDAHSLPFKQASFDVVVVFEAIYYFARPQEFLKECCRVLRPQGVLLVSSANKDWEGFIPSWLSSRYFSAQETRELLNSVHFAAAIFGGFPDSNASWRSRAVLKIRRLAAQLGVIPRTMRGKETIKQFFYGPLVQLGNEIDGDPSNRLPLFPIDASSSARIYKVLYAVGTLKPGDLTGPAP